MSNTIDRTKDEGPAGELRVPLLFVLIECDRVHAGSSRHVLADIDRVEIGRGDRRRAIRTERTLELQIPDSRVSRQHARLVRRRDAWVAEEGTSVNGLIIDGVRQNSATLADGAILELGHTLLLYAESPAPTGPPDQDVSHPVEPAPRFRTFLPALERSLEQVAAIVKTTASILIQGETGTGKELMANVAHSAAERSGTFVAVNCGALPASLVESQLFGHRKGAFTGADRDHKGFVRSAHGGTLFLDEIADLPLPAQAALLRVLQERKVTPVGDSEQIDVDLRVIAASHHDLSQRVEGGEFRRDLYARLAAFTVHLPPLRERRCDFGLLLAALLPRGATLSPQAARELLCHDWPLNVRGLESCLRVATALAGDKRIKREHVGAAIPVKLPAETRRTLAPDQQQRVDELVTLLREHRGNISAIARAVRKSRTHVHRWLDRLDLDAASFRR